MTREEASANLLEYLRENEMQGSVWATALAVAISALREQPRWIPVTERLPDNKEHDWVLAQVVEDNGYMHIPKVMEYRQNRNDWFEETYGWISEHNGAFVVTHWMPLPEPPEVEV